MIDSKNMKIELDEMKKEMGLPDPTPPNHLTGLMDSLNTPEYLKQLNRDDLFEHAILFSNYSYYLQTQENRYNAYLNFLEGNLKLVVGKNLDQVPSNFFTEKDSYIRSREPIAMQLSDEKIKVTAKLDSIKFLAQKINHLADMLKALAVERGKK